MGLRGLAARLQRADALPRFLATSAVLSRAIGRTPLSFGERVASGASQVRGYFVGPSDPSWACNRPLPVRTLPLPSRVPMKCIGIAIHPLPLGEGKDRATPSLMLDRLAGLLPPRKPILIDLHFLEGESMLEQGTPCGAAGGADVAGGMSALVKHDGLVFG